jgi:Rrf2 family transcriptional regulator, cysteine metabolism repressor
MKISARDEYACAAVLELALNYDAETPVRVQDIAQRQEIPMKFLFQIMQILKRVDIVKSRRGTEGGYSLGRPPGQITVGDVIRALRGPVDGPFVQVSVADSGHFVDIWSEVDRAIGGVLNNITFEELVRRTRANQRHLMYHI